MKIGKKCSRGRRVVDSRELIDPTGEQQRLAEITRARMRTIIPIVDPNRQKEIDLPRGSRGWPDGMRFEDAERVERRTIQRVAPHTADRQSFLGNSSLLCTQSLRW